MKKDSRWMKSILAASATPAAGLPWQRGNRRLPMALKPVPQAPKAAAAAR
jgi:hypothetical protein